MATNLSGRNMLGHSGIRTLRTNWSGASSSPAMVDRWTFPTAGGYYGRSFGTRSIGAKTIRCSGVRTRWWHSSGGSPATSRLRSTTSISCRRCSGRSSGSVMRNSGPVRTRPGAPWKRSTVQSRGSRTVSGRCSRGGDMSRGQGAACSTACAQWSVVWRNCADSMPSRCRISPSTGPGCPMTSMQQWSRYSRSPIVVVKTCSTPSTARHVGGCWRAPPVLARVRSEGGCASRSRLRR